MRLPLKLTKRHSAPVLIYSGKIGSQRSEVLVLTWLLSTKALERSTLFTNSEWSTVVAPFNCPHLSLSRPKLTQAQSSSSQSVQRTPTTKALQPGLPKLLQGCQDFSDHKRCKKNSALRLKAGALPKFSTTSTVKPS